MPNYLGGSNVIRIFIRGKQENERERIGVIKSRNRDWSDVFLRWEKEP